MSGVDKEGTREDVIQYWLGMANESLDSADLEYGAGHLVFAINRAYYACFYSAMALLLTEGRRFSKHSGVLSEFQRTFVKTGKVPAELGKVYRGLFTDRQRGDYTEEPSFVPQEVAAKIDRAKEFVEYVRGLAENHG